MTHQSQDHIRHVVEYYDATKRDYRYIWRTNKSLGVHFGYYDQDHTTHDTAILNLNRQLATIGGIKEEDHVLDAGCGLGGSAIWLAKHIGCLVTGVNIVPWHNERARHNAKRRGVDALVDFKLADFARTGLPAASFTVVWGIESIVHAQDKAAVINEAYRLLKPGGRLLIAEYLLKEALLTAYEQEQLDIWLNGWAMPSLLSRKQYQAILKKAGFKKIKFHDWTENVQPSFDRLKRYAKVASPLAPALHKLHLVNRGQLGNIRASNAQMATLARGVWRYQAICAYKPVT